MVKIKVKVSSSILPCCWSALNPWPFRILCE